MLCWQVGVGVVGVVSALSQQTQDKATQGDNILTTEGEKYLLSLSAD